MLTHINIFAKLKQRWKNYLKIVFMKFLFSKLKLPEELGRTTIVCCGTKPSCGLATLQLLVVSHKQIFSFLPRNVLLHFVI